MFETDCTILLPYPGPYTAEEFAEAVAEARAWAEDCALIEAREAQAEEFLGLTWEMYD